MCVTRNGVAETIFTYVFCLLISGCDEALWWSFIIFSPVNDPSPLPLTTDLKGTPAAAAVDREVDSEKADTGML